LGKRHAILAIALPVDDELPRLPVDVIERQRSHLAGAEAQANHEKDK
jgi:hypothetical protein